ncbi:putative membrane protein (TIGR04086 family) [Virgibacillus natechei]|uniref:Membrane protein (TIGR04086 family) n=1 Tax=Virgibacillus natechei TaxID=1216297 RepID=A0ABS4ICW4_9BACI|nr:TIGR04086 family membrane protein [Virgibacillus natechei]MBP1968777.1 putative membrane protein (TIGR04086 family) [Virgibacillus natechei]UZD11577.1 TIGR04086 family membrane protein [Virgibacillus natechei]
MKTNQFTALMYGWIVVFGLILIASLILAALLSFTTFDEPTITWVTLIIGIISLLLGGITAGVKGKSKGWVIGATVGLGFSFFIFLVQYLGYQQLFSLEQSIHHIGYIAAALFGGVIGVNVVDTADE